MTKLPQLLDLLRNLHLLSCGCVKNLSFKRGQLLKKEEGAALIETAITLPILILLISGIFEFTNYALINNKLVRAVGVLGDMVARQNLSRTNLIALMGTVDVIMTPFNKNQQIRIVVSQVRNNGMTTDPKKMLISWQQQINGAVSNIGTPGNAPVNLPNNITVINNQSIIVTEVYFNYDPIVFNGFFASKPIYKISVFVPRVGSMSALIGEG